MKSKLLLSAVLFVACGPVALDDPGPSLESSEAALKTGPGTGGTGGGDVIGDPGNPPPPLSCADRCTPQSRCDEACGPNAGQSCGTFGRCQACSSVCTSTTSCNTPCLGATGLTLCYAGGYPCAQCSAAVCERSGCAKMCQLPESVVFSKTGAVTLPRTYSRCDAFGDTINDADSDGLDDDFELDVAKRFMPQINMDHWSEVQFYAGQDADHMCTGPRCNLPVVIRKAAPLTGSRHGWCATGQCLELIYGLPYNWDTGDPDAVSGAPVIYNPHRGDAEFVAVLIAHRRADDEPDGADWGIADWNTAVHDVNAWRQVAQFYPSHYQTSADTSRYIFPRSGSTYSQTASMTVWAAEGKHASYPTSDQCDNGGWWNSDWCGGHWLDHEQLKNRVVNVGEEYAGYICAGFERYIASPAASAGDPATGQHDVWGGQLFDSTSTWYLVLNRFSRDWGNDYVSYSN